MATSSHAPASPAKPPPSAQNAPLDEAEQAHRPTPPSTDLAPILAAVAADAEAAGLPHVHGRLQFFARLLWAGVMMPSAVVAELDRFASERASIASRSAPAGSEARALLDKATGLAELAADRLRFATLPEDGPGAELVPFIQEACDRRLLHVRAALERVCRALAEGRSTPEQASGDLDVLAPPGAVIEDAELLERARVALVGGAS